MQRDHAFHASSERGNSEPAEPTKHLKMSGFIFNHETHSTVVHSAQVPAGIESEAALFETLSEALRFPDYFGCNWDALDECIRDLSWLPPGDVSLSHADLPLSQDHESLATYLEILDDAIKRWNTIGSNLLYISPEPGNTSELQTSLRHRKFKVVFPAKTKDTVERLLADCRG